MTSKQVTRYQCDFCRKKGYSAGHMAKHERHCTMNPGRDCRVCKMVGAVKRPIGDLVAVLPVHSREYYEGLVEEDGVISKGRAEVLLALPALREACSGCPACMLAALRQAHIPLWLVKPEFDFTAEMGSLWNEINEAQRTEY